MRNINGIILAHGLNGELGVPYHVRHSRLPWPRLDEDMDNLRATLRKSVLLLGKTSYIASGGYLELSGDDGTAVLGVGHSNHGSIFPTIEQAVEFASNEYPDRKIWIGGGAKLAASAFELLEAQGEGEFHETVVQGAYPKTDAFIPPYNENRWTEPEVIASFGPKVIVGRTTVRGLDLPEVVPAYYIQVRHVKPRD